MHKNMAALAECDNDFIKLRILSARDPEVLEGYQRAWPQYFAEGQTAPTTLSHINERAREIAVQDGFSPESASAYWEEACVRLGIPLIEVLFPWDTCYKKHGIPATRGLQFQCGDFSEIQNGSVVRLYHTSWIVISFDDPVHGGLVKLAPLTAIDLSS